MNIPQNIKIGGLNYAVEITDNFKNGSLNCYGECRIVDLKIMISNNIAKERQEFTLIHEALHAIFDNLGMGDIEENKVHRLGSAVYQLIVDNPEVFNTKKGE